MPNQRKLFNENKGMVTIQSDFNQNPNTASWLKNSFIRKNGTRQKVEGNTLLNDSLDDEPVWNVVEYVSINGQSEILVQIENRWYRLEDDNSLTELQSLSDTEKHYTTQFNGRLILGSRNQFPQKYLYLQNPVKPTTDSIAGQSPSGEPQRTYYVRIAYESPNGVTEASISTVQDVANDEYLKVNAPSDQEGADGYRVYVSLVEGEENLQEKNLGINTDYNEEDHGIVVDSQVKDYPEENDAWVWSELGNDAPYAQYWTTHNGRVFAGGLANDDMEIRYSALNDEDDWSFGNNADEAGALEFDRRYDEGDINRGIGSNQQYLVVFFEKHISVLNFPTDQTKFSIEQTMKGKGCVGHNSIINVGGELFWLSKHGVEAISQEFGTENLLYDDENPSIDVNNLIANDTKKVVENDNQHLVESHYYPLRNWVIFQIPETQTSNDVIQQRWWVFDLDEGNWSFISNEARSLVVDRTETVYSTGKGEVYEEFDGTFDRDGGSYDFEWTTPWLYLDDPHAKKNINMLYIPVESDRETSFTLTAVVDMGDSITEQRSIDVDLQDNSEFSVARWGQGIYSDTVKGLIEIPLSITGRAFKFVFEHSEKKDFRVPWYQILYSPGGDR